MMMTPRSGCWSVVATVDWTWYIVTLYVIVSDVHQWTHINIEINLPLVWSLNNYIDVVVRGCGESHIRLIFI